MGCSAKAVTDGCDPPEQAQTRALAPTVRSAIAPLRPEAFEGVSQEGEHEIGADDLESNTSHDGQSSQGCPCSGPDGGL